LGSIPVTAEPFKIGGTMLKIHLRIQWNPHRKWDSVNS
jgi:hypothetical protein